MVFTGTYEHSIDSKGRLAIPAGIRAQIQRSFGSVEGQSVPLFVTPGEDNSLCIYTREGFEKRAEELEKSEMPAEELLAYEEILFAFTREVELDTQGRVSMPKDLVARAGLGGEVVILGAKDHLKVRDRKAWEEKVHALFQKNPGMLMNPRLAARPAAK